MGQKSPAEEVHTHLLVGLGLKVLRHHGEVASGISPMQFSDTLRTDNHSITSWHLHGKARCQSPSHDFTLLHLSFASINSNIVSFKLHCTFTSQPAHSRSRHRHRSYQRPLQHLQQSSWTPLPVATPITILLQNDRSTSWAHSPTAMPLQRVPMPPEHTLLIRPCCPHSHTPSATISEASP